jgi:selenide, water dikinase
LAWPGASDIEELERIVRGGATKMTEAGCVVVGGHSVTDPEIKFGYAITGVVHPDRVRTNAGARAGDTLMLTKPLGTGVIATALKQGVAREEDVRTATSSMLTLNRAAAEAIQDLEIHALTDITGFGLLGHGREMAAASGVTLEFAAAKIPFLPGALEYARAGALAGGLRNNREFVGPCVEGSSEFDDLLYDPQTSGGLLIALPPNEAAKLARRFPAAVEIGRVREAEGKLILIR